MLTSFAANKSSTTIIPCCACLKIYSIFTAVLTTLISPRFKALRHNIEARDEEALGYMDEPLRARII